IDFFDFGTFEGKDENNNPTGDFGSNSWAVSLAYSQTTIKNLAVGAAAKFILFEISDFTETAVAADFGLQYSIPAEEVSFGLGVFNVGTTTSAFLDTKDDLPFNVQFGASKRLEHLPLMVSGALVKYRDDSVDFRLGGEFTLTEELFLRLGYNSIGRDQKVDTGKDQLAGVSLGLGFKLNQFNLDYSFSSFGEVGSLNRLSLTGRF
ncbi:MAG: PorV/PorQ family protein, partial [bacterium]